MLERFAQVLGVIRSMGLALVIIPLLWACDLMGSKQPPKEFISLLLPDSLKAYHSVRIQLISLAKRDTLETIWNDSLFELKMLRKLPTRNYKGGPVDIYVAAGQGADIPFRILIQYREENIKPVVLNLPPLMNPRRIAPELTLIGNNEVYLEKGRSYVDLGAICWDQQDGEIIPEIISSVDTSEIGSYGISYHCVDMDGNTTDKKYLRIVNVIAAIDRVAPEVFLIGQEFTGILAGQTFVDSGSVCIDDVDTGLTVERVGFLKTDSAGVYKLFYSCKDRSNNRSPQKTRTVQVIKIEDKAKPRLIINSERRIEVGQGTEFKYPTVLCFDELDGNLEVTQVGSVNTANLGDQILNYSCVDRSSNVDTATLIVTVSKLRIIRVEQESQIDTSDIQRNPNLGYTGTLKFSQFNHDNIITLIKFDLAKVSKSGLQSARIRFNTYASGETPTKDTVDFNFRINSLKSSWVEGTGNWFWAGGAWLNNGDRVFANYTLSDSIKAKSTNPLFSDGLSPADRDIVNPENLVFLSSQIIRNSYGAASGLGPIPGPKELVTVELDVTDYVKETSPDQDFGFFITIDSGPIERPLSFLSKEIGDGRYGPQLILGY